MRRQHAHASSTVLSSGSNSCALGSCNCTAAATWRQTWRHSISMHPQHQRQQHFLSASRDGAHAHLYVASKGCAQHLDEVLHAPLRERPPSWRHLQRPHLQACKVILNSRNFKFEHADWLGSYGPRTTVCGACIHCCCRHCSHSMSKLLELLLAHTPAPHTVHIHHTQITSQT
jgi:hypothetical protein